MQSQPAPTPCGDDEMIAAFLEGRLDAREASAVDAHLDACAGCRGLVADFARAYGDADGTRLAAGVRAAEGADAEVIARLDARRAARMALAPGATFGRYQIEALLGQGGMGRVYRAVDKKLQRRVALKVIDLADTDPDERADAGALLLHEARAAAAIDHPNAAAVFDVAETNGTPYIVMELISGASLRTFVGDPAVTLATRLRWLLDVARTLAAAHARGLVHRDVKPENVMVRDDGVVKVLDFGIARRGAPIGQAPPSMVSTLPQLKGAAGTPRYMAPEQLRGDALDGRADQFAWGVLAYELLSGEAPWATGGDAFAVAAQVLSVDPAPLRAVAPLVGADVGKIVTRAMQRKKEDRFATMDDLAAALAPFVTGDGATVAIGAVATAAPTPPRAAPRRSPGWRIAIAGLSLGLAAIAAFAWPRHPAPSAATGAQTAIAPPLPAALPPPPAVRAEDSAAPARAAPPPATPTVRATRPSRTTTTATATATATPTTTATATATATPTASASGDPMDRRK